MRAKRFLGVIFLILLVVGVWMAYHGFQRKTTSSSRIAVSGNVEITDIDISFQVAGKVNERLVSEGDGVKTGQRIARLDRTEFELHVANARAALTLSQAEARRAALEYHRQQELYNKGALSEREYVLAEAGYAITQAGVQEAQAALALAETRLSYTDVISPMDGIVMTKHIEAGEYVQPGTPVVTVGDVRHPWFRVYITETDLGRVKIGQKAMFRVDSYPGKKYEGRVVFIASESEFTPKNVQTEKERVKLVYRIKVEVPNESLELKPGMPVDGEILLP